MRYLTAILAATILAILVVSTAVGQAAPEFKLGFKALADQVPDVVGAPLENEHWGANGDSLQRTSNGLMAWRKADNWTAFTNGYMTWINGPNGVESRLNPDRFPWESDPVVAAPPPAPAPAPAPPPTPAPTRAPAPVPAPTPVPAPASANSMSADGMTVTVNGVNRVTQLGRLYTAPAGKVFLQVDLTIRCDAASGHYNPYDFKIQAGDGFQYDHTYKTADNPPPLHAGDFERGAMVRGIVTFELPTSAGGLRLIYRPSIVSPSVSVPLN